MVRRRCRYVLMVLAVALCLSAFGQLALAQGEAAQTNSNLLALRPAQDEPPPAEQATESEVMEEAVEGAEPLPGPKYFNLRYNEDFSYLDGPADSYQRDFFDPIKWIHLTDDLTLTIGGDFRMRLESETNTRFGAAEPAQDTFLLWRAKTHLDLRYRKSARIFFEGVTAFIEDRDRFPLATFENRWDIHQLFFDVKPLGDESPLTFRVGRQELLFGRERLVSPLGWANTRRRFDAAAVMYNTEKFDLTGFYSKPVPVSLAENLNRRHDTFREESHFYGLYATCKAIENHVIDLYFLGLNDKGDLVNANGRTGDLSVYTIGGRMAGKCGGGFDYDGELAGQWGTFAGDVVQAWMAGAEMGYTFEGITCQPRIGIGFDYGSGDGDPRDGAHQTSNQLFPLGHAHLGYLDLFARQNVLASNVNVSGNLHEKVKARLAWYTFWNDDKRDALYNAGGAAVRRNVFGNAGHDVGNELDLTIRYAMDVHQAVLFGYSHFWGNNFIRATGPSEDADLIYLQYEFKF